MEDIVAMPSCRTDYNRWAKGDLSSEDVVDKWGGGVHRQFQTWYMQLDPQLKAGTQSAIKDKP